MAKLAINGQLASPDAHLVGSKSTRLLSHCILLICSIKIKLPLRTHLGCFRKKPSLDFTNERDVGSASDGGKLAMAMHPKNNPE